MKKRLFDMDFKIINNHLTTQFQEICRRINRLQSGGTIDSLNTIGANTDNQIGASFLSLKELAGRYTPDEPLALLLWNEHRREEQIVACLLLPHAIEKEKLTQLAADCLSFEIAEYLGSLYLHRHAQLPELTTEWLNSDHPFHQTAALTALSKYLILHKTEGIISKEFYREAVQREFQHKYVQLLAQRYRFNL